MAETNDPDSPDTPADRTSPSPEASSEISSDPGSVLGESLDGDGNGAGSPDGAPQPSETSGSQTAESTAGSDSPAHQSDQSSQNEKPTGSPARPQRFKRLRKRLNIYSMLFILLLIIAAAIILVAYQQNQSATKSNGLKTQELSASTLQKLADNDLTVGNNRTVLKVQSSTIFGGQVLVKQSLEVAGNLRIGGTAAFNDIDAAGTSQFGQVSVSKDLSVTGNTALQGATVAKSLQVGGGGTFKGPLSAPQITAGSLQLNGNLVLTHHIEAGGNQPGRGGGPALGSGGSVSVSGSDIAGAVNINTGSGPAAGCFVTVTFANRYNSTPNVLVTPVGSAAGSLSYYVNRSASNFSICVASAPPAGKSFGFDYFVVE